MAITDMISLTWFSENIYTFILVFAIIIATIFSAKLVDRMMKGYMKKARTTMKVNETMLQLFQHIAIAAIYFIGFMLIISSIPQLHSLSVAIVTGAGLAGVVVGFAAQDTIGNIVSGISLAVFQPFRIGDYVTVHDEYGRITDISLRHTIVTTWDNRRLIIPNSLISSEAIVNWSIEDPTVMWPVDIGISYDSDIRLARSIMMEEAEKHQNVMTYQEVHADHPDIQEGSEIKVLVTELGDFAVMMKMLVWLRDRNFAYVTGCELMESIKERFDAEGVEIPFPYRTLVYKNDLKVPKISQKIPESIPEERGGEFHLQEGESEGSNNNSSQ